MDILWSWWWWSVG